MSDFVELRHALTIAEQHAQSENWDGHPLAIILQALIKKTRAVLANAKEKEVAPDGLTDKYREHVSTTSELAPPSHLVDMWTKDWEEIFPDQSLSLQRYITTKAADWQVKECARWLTEKDSCLVDGLYAAMRPKPKSLADMAISDWNLLQSDLDKHCEGISYFGNIERALKRLKELEGNQALPYLSPCPDADS